MSLFSLLAPRRATDHVRADVAAGVNDPEAYVLAHLKAPTESTLALQSHRLVMSDEAEARELAGDLRAQRRTNPPNPLGALGTWALLMAYFLVELWTLALILIGHGLPAAGAYGWAFVAASTLVGVVRGATHARSRTTRLLCYAALGIVFITIGWIRAGELSNEGGAPVDTTANGILAVVATVGATVALHRLGEQARATGETGRKLRETQRHVKRMERDISKSKRALIREDLARQQYDTAATRLRVEYARLHRIETARLHAPPVDAARGAEEH